MTEAPPPPTSPDADPAAAPPSAGAGGATGIADPPPPAAPPRPPIRRSSSDRLLGGVAAGVARWLGVEPVPVRIGFVVLAVVGPPLLLGYLAAWLLLPSDDAPAEEARPRDAAYWFGIAIAAVVVVALAASLDGGGDGPLVALALVGVGVALWRRGDVAAAQGSGPDAAPPGAVGTGGVGGPTTAAGAAPAAVAGRGGGGELAARRDRAAWTPPPRVPRERSPLGWLTLGLALLAAGVAAALDAQGTVALDWTQLAAVAVVVLGLGLVVGAFLGRARWLNLLVVLLLPLVFAGSAVRGFADLTDIDIDLAGAVEDGIGERRLVFAGSDTLPEELGLGIGELDVDLRDLELGADDTLTVEQGVGLLRVLLPADLAWRADVEVGIGDLELVTRDVDGRLIDAESVGGDVTGATYTRGGGPPGGPVLDLDLQIGAGEVEIVTFVASEDATAITPTPAPRTPAPTPSPAPTPTPAPTATATTEAQP